MATGPVGLWRELPMRAGFNSLRLSIVRRLLFARIADLGRLAHRDDTSFETCDLLAIGLQLGMQTKQSLVHLFEVVLSVSQRRFEADQSLFGRGRRAFRHRGGVSV